MHSLSPNWNCDCQQPTTFMTFETEEVLLQKKHNYKLVKSILTFFFPCQNSLYKLAVEPFEKLTNVSRLTDTNKMFGFMFKASVFSSCLMRRPLPRCMVLTGLLSVATRTLSIMSWLSWTAAPNAGSRATPGQTRGTQSSTTEPTSATSGTSWTVHSSPSGNIRKTSLGQWNIFS